LVSLVFKVKKRAFNAKVSAKNKRIIVVWRGWFAKKLVIFETTRITESANLFDFA
jgi:hypothetical protein